MTDAWLAGFFEGEGSAILDKRGRLHITLYQKDMYILTEIKLKHGGGLVNRIVDKKTGRKCGRLVWTGPKASVIASIIYPYLIGFGKKQNVIRDCIERPRTRP